LKRLLLHSLKIILPLALGVGLIVFFYRELSPTQRQDLFASIRMADPHWLWLSLGVAVLSHASRAWRWRYLLEHLGHSPSFWSCFHAVMAGYFMNLLLPRAGEATRAVILARTQNVPFAKGFGTILAERLVDAACLLALCAVTLGTQLDKVALFRQRLALLQQDQPQESRPWGAITLTVLVVVAIIAVAVFLRKPALRARAKDVVRGFSEGLRSVISTRKKGLFVLHSLVIWALYLVTFWLGFLCLPSTREVPLPGIMAGFVGGAIGITLVQGGVGVYPAIVGLVVSMYLPAPEGGGLLRPDALAMGWLLWTAQTAVIILLGGLALLLASLKRNAT
jgi:glycosyltransferase 2 family protein